MDLALRREEPAGQVIVHLELLQRGLPTLLSGGGKGVNHVGGPRFALDDVQESGQTFPGAPQLLASLAVEKHL